MPTILVVEDEPMIQGFLADLLSDEGYRVLTAPNGMEALHILRKDCPDLILSDIMMPVMDGIRLCQEVQRNPSTRHVPILLMSAVVQPIGQDVCTPQGFIPKPLVLDQVLTTIARLLASGSETDQQSLSQRS